MKKLAARDFEDLLQVRQYSSRILQNSINHWQCSIPVFEELVPTKAGNSLIMDLLFIFCSWHALAKLRLHTASTIRSLEKETRSLGKVLRQFLRQICKDYVTHELPRENKARARRGKRKAREADDPSAKETNFNLNTFKLHALGHYPEDIRNFGTTDNYSTQRVRLSILLCH